MSYSSGVLSDQQILDELSRDNVFIYPFVEKNLSNTSYDVTLGPYYYRAKKNEGALFLPWNEDSVSEYWGQCQFAKTIMSEYDSKRFDLPIGTQYILLEPGELILGHTNEFIGGKNHITTMMKARSSMGRIGISVCKDAGWGDVSYVSKWTMELSNFSNATIPLVVGSRIAQIVFFYTGKVKNPYEKKGIYQLPYNDYEEMMSNWSPYNMLPKFRF
jgi:dCTP deaminase